MMIYGAVNLNKNELKQAKIENLASDPSNGVAGQIYFNTTDHVLKIYDDSTSKWKSIGEGAVKTVKANGVSLADSSDATAVDLKNLTGFDATQDTQLMFVQNGVFSFETADFADGRYF